MKTFIILFLLIFFTTPSISAETKTVESSQPSHADQQEKEEKPAEKKEETKPGEYVCQYYTVDLPADWQAILPPTESQGQVSAVFCKNGQNPSVTMTIAEHGGVPAKTIAEMFAEQFKAPKAPVVKNGQYVFSYTLNDIPNQVWITTEGPLFMITAIGGNQKEGMNFIKNAVHSEKYSSLLPK